MNLSELLLNIKAVDFDSFVQQTEIKTEEDKKNLMDKGYHFVLTENEFCEKFKINPSCVWYTPSISQSSIYFNKESLAVSFLPLDYLYTGINKDVNGFYKVIKEKEEEVSNKSFQSSISCLPDAMQIEYFKMLVDKFRSDIPGLYNLYFSNYILSDYGFGKIDSDTLNVILDSKTEKDKEKTEKKLSDLPDTLKIFRGGNSASTSADKSYSWTLDINVANFFACRRGSGDGYIACGEVSKKDIIEVLLDERNEQEVFVDPKNIRILSNMKIKGLDYIENVLPKIAPMYREYMVKMEQLDFAQDSNEHGYEHEARVLLLALTIAEHMNLSITDKRILSTAAIYHDTMRVNDCTDEEHGKASREYYHSNEKRPNPTVEFLCEYHCLPDEAGYLEIMNNKELSKNRRKTKLLIDIFKDADALDRVRFGLKDLDMNQLRLPISKELSLVARMYLEQVKVNVKTKKKTMSLDDKIRNSSGNVSKGRGKTKSVEREKL